MSPLLTNDWGAHGPNSDEQARLEEAPASIRKKITKWEEFLNRDDAKHAKTAGNPFKVFEQIPPRSRYRFLLDNIHYIITT